MFDKFMDYANLIIIAYEFTYTCLNCVNLLMCCWYAKSPT